MTAPDYAIIDRALEVPGARPEKRFCGADVRLTRIDGDWLWVDAGGGLWDELSEPTALAVVRDWLEEWIVFVSRSNVFIREPDGPYTQDSQGRQLRPDMHPERTTALALLVRRVHETTSGAGAAKEAPCE